jgi:hypothetical protein
MNIEKAYNDNEGKILFHLRLCSGHKNRWYTSLPPPLILKYFPSEIFHLKNALIVKESQAIRLLDNLARKIIKKQEMKPFFYPDYLMNEPNSLEVDTLIWMQHKFNFEPNMVFNSIICPIEFYYLEQIFNMNASQILKTGTKIKYRVLVKKYLTNSFVKKAFELIDNESTYYLEMNDEKFDYVLVILETQMLMVISV